jgi:hypothetical protein
MSSTDPNELFSISDAIPAGTGQGPLLQWRPKLCAECVFCEWERFHPGVLQVPRCSNRDSKCGYFDADKVACGLFQARPASLAIIALSRSKCLKPSKTFTTGPSIKSTFRLMQLGLSVLRGLETLAHQALTLLGKESVK